MFTHKVQKRDAADRGGGTVHMPFMLREYDAAYKLFSMTFLL